MRIPLTQADWPAAFNDVSKFIGRHWPHGKLKLNQARETTAYLLGYNSVHDAKQELLDQLIPSGHSIADYAQSMSLKALVKFQLNPLATRNLFTDIPWRTLACWEITRDCHFERMQERRQAEGEMPLIFDEFGLHASQKSPKLLVDMIDSGRLPDTEYAVNTKGLMYRRDAIEGLLTELEISTDDLAELSFTGSVEDFISEYIEPMVWQPIEEQIKYIDYQGNVEWRSPFLRRVDYIEGVHRIFHEGYQAYYAPLYDSEAELIKALTALYMGKPISERPTNEDSLFIAGEYYERTEADVISDYSAIRGVPWLSKQAWPAACAVADIDPRALPAEINSDHDRIDRWCVSAIDKAHKLVLSSECSAITAAFSAVMKNEYFSLETLQEDGEFLPDSDEGDTEQYDPECEERIQEATEEGVKIFKYHPELHPYYDAVAICAAYQDYCGNTRDWFYSCGEREPEFLAYIFGLACLRQFEKTCKQWKLVAAIVLGDIVSQTLETVQVSQAWADLCCLLSLHASQDPKIQMMREWANHSNSGAGLYLSRGDKAKITRKSFSEQLSDVHRKGRRLNMITVPAVQDAPKE